ncbi:MAG: transposase [Bacilli bacterium]|nr:transposase [Bacilli bacterium]
MKKKYSRCFGKEINQKYIVTYSIKKTRKAITTFINIENCIENAFTYKCSNGITEEMNNLIK